MNAVFILRAAVHLIRGIPPWEYFFFFIDLWWTFEILDLPDISIGVAPRRVWPPRFDANCEGPGRLFEVEEYGSWGCGVKNTGLLGPTKCQVRASFDGI